MKNPCHIADAKHQAHVNFKHRLEQLQTDRRKTKSKPDKSKDTSIRNPEKNKFQFHLMKIKSTEQSVSGCDSM